jgi:hypothetical protein
MTRENIDKKRVCGKMKREMAEFVPDTVQSSEMGN